MRDIWIFDLARGMRTKLTFDQKDDTNPVWSPDGSRIAFTSDRAGVRNLYVKSASGAGAEELLVESNNDQNAEDWPHDGGWIIVNEPVAGKGRDLRTVSLSTRKTEDFLATKVTEDEAQFSPDGKWIAYRSIDAGHSDVYVETFRGLNPGSRGKWLVSNPGGAEPHCRGDGRELFYLSMDSPPHLMAVDIAEENGGIVRGMPHSLFELRLIAPGRNRWLVTPDGNKFLAIVPVEQKPSTTLNVIVNWPRCCGNSRERRRRGRVHRAHDPRMRRGDQQRSDGLRPKTQSEPHRACQ